MKLHANARTCPHSRRLAVDRVEREGWTLAAPADPTGRSSGGERGESRRNYDTRYTPFSHFQRPFVSLH
jgi:hypothetical protein